MERWIVVLCLFVVLGHVNAQYQPRFSSVANAVETLPELSVLNTQVSKLSVANQLKNTAFVGTVFAPINSGIQRLVNDLNGDLTQLGSAAQVNDIFSTAILTSKVMLEQLTDGQTLTSQNGNTVKITIKQMNGGKVYYANSARITTANILAGQAVVHEVTPLLLPSSYQSLFDSMGYQDTTPVVPTAVYDNPLAPTTDTSAGGGTTTGGSGSGSGSSSGSSSGSTSGSSSGSASTGDSGSTTPGSSTSGPTASSPAPTTTDGSSSGSSGGSNTSPAPTGGSSDTSSGSSGSATTPTSSPAPAGSTGSTGSGTAGSTSTSPGSSGTTTTTTTTTPTPTGSTGSTNTQTSAAGGGSTTSGSTGTTSYSAVTSTTSAGSSSSSGAITAESAKVDPDFGLDISAGHRAAFGTMLLALPLLVAAAL